MVNPLDEELRARSIVTPRHTLEELVDRLEELVELLNPDTPLFAALRLEGPGWPPGPPRLLLPGARFVAMLHGLEERPYGALSFEFEAKDERTLAVRPYYMGQPGRPFTLRLA